MEEPEQTIHPDPEVVANAWVGDWRALEERAAAGQRQQPMSKKRQKQQQRKGGGQNKSGNKNSNKPKLN